MALIASVIFLVLVSGLIVLLVAVECFCDEEVARMLQRKR